MAFVKTTWTDNAAPSVSAAQLNRIEQGIDDLYNPPRVRVRRVTDLVWGPGTWAEVNFDGEDYDPQNLHDNSANQSRLVANRDGLWVVFAKVVWPLNATGRRDMTIRHYNVAGTGFDEPVADQGHLGNSDAYTQVSVYGEVVAVTGEQFRLAIFQSSGGNLTLPAGNSFFGARWVSA